MPYPHFEHIVHNTFPAGLPVAGRDAAMRRTNRFNEEDLFGARR
jgi:hypothetical protein